MPGTTVLDRGRVVGARLRPLTGREELLCHEQADRWSGVALADALLGVCVVCLDLEGGARLGPAGRLGQLTVGDREALLLRLRQVTFGERLSLVVDCPDPACGQPMDLDFRVDDVCCQAQPAAEAEHEAEVATGPGGAFWKVAVRLPTGADQAAVATQALDDPDGAGRSLARRCLVRARSPQGDDIAPDEVDSDVLDGLSDVLAGLDPQAQVELDLTCPTCGQEFSSLLDGAELLRSELTARKADLLSGLHLLAFHYHWSEEAVLDLPTSRRRLYVETLADALSTPARWE